MTKLACSEDLSMRINLASEEFGYGQGFGDLIGFATDLQNIFDLFDKQHKGLDERFNDSKILVAHLKKLINTLILNEVSSLICVRI